MEKTIEKFIRDYLSEIEQNNAAIFAGAGLSAGSGAVDWRGLLKDFAEDLGLDVKKETDLISIIQFHLNKNANNRHDLSQKIIKEFHSGKTPNENHEILARLPISTYWTTNYDRLIEKALENAGKRVDVKYTIPHLARTIHGRDTIVYKMHGDVEHPDESILSKDQYERYFLSHGPYINALSGDLVSKTFLFIGFSFTDPNLDYILSRIRVTFKENQRHHYCILREIKKDDDETQEEYEYKRIKQALIIEDLKRFNIKVLLVKEFPEITQILKEIEDRFKRKTVFISGSAHNYGKWSDSEATIFISSLSKTLIQKNFKIVSGFGLGVGSSVINGVLEEIYMGRKEVLKDQLLLRPFPQDDRGKEKWDIYRKDMISYAGIAIFLFGNKLEEGKVKIADGIKREFEIAVEQGVLVIPIGATGYQAKELWSIIMNDFDKYYDAAVKPLFEALGDTNVPLETHISTILKIIKHFKL